VTAPVAVKLDTPGQASSGTQRSTSPERRPDPARPTSPFAPRQRTRLLLPFASLARAGDVHRLAVFRHGEAGDGEAVFGQLLDEMSVAIGFFLVLAVDDTWSFTRTASQATSLPSDEQKGTSRILTAPCME